MPDHIYKHIELTGTSAWIERDDDGAGRRREDEERVGEAGVDRDLGEGHGHGVLELIVQHRLADDVVLRIDAQHQSRQERRRVLGREVEHGTSGGVDLGGGIQEAHGELVAHAPEPGEEAAGGAGERLGGAALVHLVQLRRVDPERRAVGDDLLGRRARVLPAHLAALLEIDDALAP